MEHDNEPNQRQRATREKWLLIYAFGGILCIIGFIVSTSTTSLYKHPAVENTSAISNATPSSTIILNPGEKLIDVSWNESSLYYTTRKMRETEFAEIYTVTTKVKHFGGESEKIVICELPLD